MRLLHLSDIHFQAPDCLNPATDPELPYRTRLLRDLDQLCVETPVSAILVSGDIAYQGSGEEFQFAEKWLKDVAERVSCRPDRIYVVPGNHDVDRGICKKSRTIQNAQRSIALADRRKREAEFRAQLVDNESGPALFKPLEAYNSFAAQFGGYVDPKNPYWTFNLDDVGGGVTLRLHGLTSTLISGLEDRDAAPGGKLYLSPLQTVLDPEPDVLNLVMAHHPPNWFLDHHDVDDAVNNRAPLQFFGHEHRQRCTQTPGYVRFSAGAVHPARWEDDWKPGYNLIDLEVVGEGAARILRVTAYVRQLQKTPEIFIPVVSPTGEAVWQSEIKFPGHAIRPLVAVPVTAPAETAPHASPEPHAAATSPAEVAMSSPSTKELFYRFFNLDESQKRDVMLKLKLIDETDGESSDEELYEAGFRLAADRGQLADLAREVEQLRH